MAGKPIYFSEEKSEEAVISRMDPKGDPRLYEVTKSLVKHLHAFVKEIEPTHEEWLKGIEFLTRSGRCATNGGRSTSCCRTSSGCRCWSTPSTTAPGRDREHHPRPLLHAGSAEL